MGDIDQKQREARIRYEERKKNCSKRFVLNNPSVLPTLSCTPVTLFDIFFLRFFRELEEENASLQAEYDRLRAKQTPGSTPDELSLIHGTDMVNEAQLLRKHKGHLEARMHVLEDHNRQLAAQLHKLQELLNEV